MSAARVCNLPVDSVGYSRLAIIPPSNQYVIPEGIKFATAVIQHPAEISVDVRCPEMMTIVLVLLLDEQSVQELFVHVLHVRDVAAGSDYGVGSDLF
jgi:hypothetical protein